MCSPNSPRIQMTEILESESVIYSIELSRIGNTSLYSSLYFLKISEIWKLNIIVSYIKGRPLKAITVSFVIWSYFVFIKEASCLIIGVAIFCSLRAIPVIALID